MAGWYLSRAVREKLAQAGSARRAVIARTLEFPEEYLPDSSKPAEWILAFDNECSLREVDEKSVRAAMEENGIPVPDDRESSIARATTGAAAATLAEVRGMFETSQAETSRMIDGIRDEIEAVRANLGAENIRDVLEQVFVQAGFDVEKQPWDVFFCYNRDDWGTVNEIRKALIERDRRFRIWIDDLQLNGGDKWLEKVREKLRTCNSAVVFCGSNGWGDGQWEEIKEIAKLAEAGKLRAFLCVLPGMGGPKCVESLREHDSVFGGDMVYFDLSDFRKIFAEMPRENDSEKLRKHKEKTDRILRNLIRTAKRPPSNNEPLSPED